MPGYADNVGIGKLMPGSAGSVAEQALTSTAVIAEWVCGTGRFQVKRIGFVVTTATVSSGNIVLEVNHRPTALSSSSEVQKDTLTIPGGVAAGTVYYTEVTPFALGPGESISLEVTTAAAGGGAAGKGFFCFEVDEDPEYKSNESEMVASA